MNNRDRAEIVIAELQRGISALGAQAAVQMRAILESPDTPPRDPWVVLKEAARRVGKSEKVVWDKAMRTPGASWLHGGRRMVNMDRLPLRPPPVE